jgi:molybdopterin molybdotransferase
VLKKNRIKLIFEKIAVKPGKPTVFGIIGKKRLFGMPGNPVSTFVIFQILIQPFLYTMTGHCDARPAVPLRLSGDITRKSIDRLEFLPVKITCEGSVRPIEYHGSAHIHAYTSADGMIAVPSGVDTITSGTIVQVALLR